MVVLSRKYLRLCLVLALSASLPVCSAYDAAASELSVTVEKIPAESQARLLVVKAYRDILKGKFSSAIAFLKKATLLEPDNSEAHRYLAYSYLKSGRVADSLEESKQVIDLGDELPHDLFAMAEALFYQGQPAKAMKFYRDALHLNPLFVDARVGVIRSLIALGKVQQAKQICLDAIYNRPAEKGNFQYKKILEELNSKTQLSAFPTYGS